MAVELTKESFRDAIEQNDIVLVDFWAPWCGPCRSFAPIYETMAEAHPDIVFAKVNTEEQPELAGAFEIRSIPTLMVFRERVIVFSQPGALPQQALEEIVARVRELDMDEVRRKIEEQEQPAQPETGPTSGA